MRGFEEPQYYKIDPDQFGEIMQKELDSSYYAGYHRVSITHLNAAHLISNQPKSELPATVQNLLMHTLNELMPLGILSINQLNDAYAVLQKIKPLLENDPMDEKTIAELSTQFYKMIPHNGTKERRKPIGDIEFYKMKERMIEHLRSVLEAIQAGPICGMNSLDYLYQFWMKTNLQPLDSTSDQFKAIKSCIDNGQHQNDNDLFEIETIFKVEPNSPFNFQSDATDRYLIHSTYPSNVFGILRDVLVVSPDHVHGFGRSLGDGIYFYDAAAMALNRFSHDTIHHGILFVCRVKLGEICHMENVQGEIPVKAEGFDSVLLKGSKYFDGFNDVIPLNDASIANANVPKIYGEKKDSLYNQYLAFNSEQVNVEYLLHLKKVDQS